LITTELGTHYILPVDGRKPLLLEGNLKLYEPRHQPACWTLNCRAWSPNGIDRAYIDESGIVELVYDKTLPGQALLFSTTSDSIAVWNQADEQLQLQIYVLPYQSSPIQVNEAQLFNAFDLALNELKPRIAAWSPDGRRLAFSDDRGVWLWDALTPAALPELLTNQPASILGFSPLGRYLVLDDGSDGQSIDLVSRSSLPKGVFSPDDRLLATLGEESKLLQLTPYYELSSDFPGLLERIQWMDSNSYYAQVCFHPENSCEVMFELVYPAFQSIGPQSRMFDVSPEAGLIATVQDDATVQIMQRNGRPFIERNLRPWLDADIADIEWLPSLFYHAAK
jgi:WD40 repeat protein